MRSSLPQLRTAGFAIAVAFACWPVFAQTGPGWITAWGTSQQVLGQTRVSNATLRLIARVTAPGDAIRLRFDNTFGTVPNVVHQYDRHWNIAKRYYSAAYIYQAWYQYLHGKIAIVLAKTPTLRRILLSVRDSTLRVLRKS